MTNGHNGNGEKKKFLFVSYEALIGDLALQVKNEANEVKYFIRNKRDEDICDGFIDKIQNWEEFVEWADVIVFDDIGFGKMAEELRKKGKLVVGGTVYTDRLELEREFGQEEMEKMGINTLPHWDFTDFDEAINFVQKNPGRYVLKPNDNVAATEKDLLFIGQEEDGKDLIRVLSHYKKIHSKKIKSFQLQKYVSGVEVAVGAFFNGEDFIFPINVNFEHKRMFPGEIGPSTGEMGTLMYWSQPNIIFERTLERMKPKIQEVGYAGYIDLNCIVNAKGIYPLEFTCRFGYPTISIMMEGVTSRWGEFLYALAAKNAFELKTKNGFQVGVVIAVPPFPFNDPDAFEKYSKNATILFKKDDNKDGVHIGDIKSVEGEWRLAGESGYALVITGSGQTVEAARKQSYSRIKNIMIPNMFYRTDIGMRWMHESDMLQTWGYMY